MWDLQYFLSNGSMTSWMANSEEAYNRTLKEARKRLMIDFVRIFEGKEIIANNLNTTDKDEIMLVLKTKKKIGKLSSQRIASLIMYSGYCYNIKTCQEAMIILVNRGIPYELFAAGLSEKDRMEANIRSKDDFILLIKNKIRKSDTEELYKAYENKLVNFVTRLYKIDNEKLSVDELEKTEWIEKASLNDILRFMEKTNKLTN